MLNFFLMLGAMIQRFFVTDCDNTIAFYNATATVVSNSTLFTISNSTPSSKNQELIKLPPSVGSGKIAYVSLGILDKLSTISKFSTVICASGMRTKTMLQRESYFPSIKYWICENGGKIFHRLESRIIEDIDWENFVKNYDRNNDCKLSLHLFANALRSIGWSVDTDYTYMIRVQKRIDLDFSSVIKNIPNNLKYTYNLGYLDIHVPICNKLSAIRWLISKLLNIDSREFNSSFHLVERDLPFIFMGDDDNDISAVAAASSAFITHPCSPGMMDFLKAQDSEGVLSSVSDSEIRRIRLSNDKSIFVSKLEGANGALKLLEVVIEQLKHT